MCVRNVKNGTLIYIVSCVKLLHHNAMTRLARSGSAAVGLLPVLSRQPSAASADGSCGVVTAPLREALVGAPCVGIDPHCAPVRAAFRDDINFEGGPANVNMLAPRGPLSRPTSQANFSGQLPK